MGSHEHRGLSKKECLALNKGKEVRLVGERFTLRSGSEVTVVEYNGCEDVRVRFEFGKEVVVQSSDLRRGSIRDPYARSVHGAGYLGEGVYGFESHGDALSTWRGMLCRVHCPLYHEKRPTYVDVTVCEEWLCFQAFAEWYYRQPNAGAKGYHLDKDLINDGIKQYNPSNCSFVPQRVNSLLSDSRAARGDLPIGVCRNGSGYLSRVGKNGKRHLLGTYRTVEEAAEVYRKAKAAHVREVVGSLEEGEVVPEVIVGLLKWADNLENS